MQASSKTRRQMALLIAYRGKGTAHVLCPQGRRKTAGQFLPFTPGTKALWYKGNDRGASHPGRRPNLELNCLQAQAGHQNTGSGLAAEGCSDTACQILPNSQMTPGAPALRVTSSRRIAFEVTPESIGLPASWHFWKEASQAMK